MHAVRKALLGEDSPGSGHSKCKGRGVAADSENVDRQRGSMWPVRTGEEEGRSRAGRGRLCLAVGPDTGTDLNLHKEDRQGLRSKDNSVAMSTPAPRSWFLMSFSNKRKQGSLEKRPIAGLGQETPTVSLGCL